MIFSHAEIMNSQRYHIWRQENREIQKRAVKVGTQVHRAENGLTFMEKCLSKGIVPHFTRLKASTLKQGKLTPAKTKELRTLRLRDEIENKKQILKDLKCKFEEIMKTISKNVSARLFRSIRYNLKVSIQQSQQKCDQKREDKFKKLSTKKSAEITVFNSSGAYVPNPVMKLLKKGLDYCPGGRPKDHDIFSSLDNFYEKWLAHAKREGISKYDIIEMHGRTQTAF